MQRNIDRKVWTEVDGEGAFYHAIDSPGDVDRKWPAILAARPDFIKIYLLHSEEFAQRRDDRAFIGWKGLDPALVPLIVQRAKTSGLRVAAHVETAADLSVSEDRARVAPPGASPRSRMAMTHISSCALLGIA